MNDEAKWQAVLARDRTKDGLFVYGVKSTGIYCRPSCASKKPKRENVLFFNTPAEAERAGFRACRRCRPDSMGGDPGRELAGRAREVLLERFRNPASAREALDGLGVSRERLSEAYCRAWGESPKKTLEALRFEEAKKSLAGGVSILNASALLRFESVSGFYAFFRRMGGLTPREYLKECGREEQVLLLDSPLGRLRLSSMAGRVTGVRLAAAGEKGGEDPGPELSELKNELLSYFKGELRDFQVPVAAEGTPFMKKVWKALSEIPYGQTMTYRELAQKIGCPASARAVGMACRRNPLLIVVPCHRVVGSNGSLTGYAAGVKAKAWLLEMEKRAAAH